MASSRSRPINSPVARSAIMQGQGSGIRASHQHHTQTSGVRNSNHQHHTTPRRQPATRRPTTDDNDNFDTARHRRRELLYRPFRNTESTAKRPIHRPTNLHRHRPSSTAGFQTNNDPDTTKTRVNLYTAASTITVESAPHSQPQ